MRCVEQCQSAESMFPLKFLLVCYLYRGAGAGKTAFHRSQGKNEMFLSAYTHKDLTVESKLKE